MTDKLQRLKELCQEHEWPDAELDNRLLSALPLLIEVAERLETAVEQMRTAAGEGRIALRGWSTYSADAIHSAVQRLEAEVRSSGAALDALEREL